MSDPRLADLDKHVNNIRRGQPSLQKGGDDGVFKNIDGDLPAKPEGYYSEFYVTKKIDGQERDKLRLVLGKGDEIYVTGDHYHDFRQIVGMPVVPRPVVGEAERRRAEALKKLRDEIERLRNKIEMEERGHRAQLDLMNNSFAGFWTNRLFNSPPPQAVIWANASIRARAALTAAQNGNLKPANANYLRAQLEYKIAMKKYLFWKEGIDGAGTKMQFAIGGVAIALVAVAVTAFAVTAAGATAATTAAAEQTCVRVAATVARADAVLLRVAVIELSEEAMLRAELEVMIEELEAMSAL